VIEPQLTEGQAPVTIESLLGVWRRESIRWPDGREDTSTIVYWLQGTTHYADIRIPIGRPSFAGVRSLAQCTPEHQRWLAMQEGFAGELRHADGNFHWIRDVDFQPPGGPRDIGRLRFTDPSRDRMTEDGVEQAYTEVWHRIDRGESTSGAALVLHQPGNEHSGGRGWFVAVGNHFIFAVDRRRGAASSPFDMEISHGLRHSAGGERIITHSTRPWREGEPLVRCELEGWQVKERPAGMIDWLST
jgi:hypothetical protein